MVECDVASSVTYKYEACDVAGFCQVLYANAAYGRRAKCACTYHVQHCTECQLDWRRQECQLLREASLRNFLCLVSNFRSVLIVVFFLLGYSPPSEFYVPTFRNTQCVPSSLPVEVG